MANKESIKVQEIWFQFKIEDPTLDFDTEIVTWKVKGENLVDPNNGERLWIREIDTNKEDYVIGTQFDISKSKKEIVDYINNETFFECNGLEFKPKVVLLKEEAEIYNPEEVDQLVKISFKISDDSTFNERDFDWRTINANTLCIKNLVVDMKNKLVTFETDLISTKTKEEIVDFVTNRTYFSYTNAGYGVNIIKHSDLEITSEFEDLYS